MTQPAPAVATRPLAGRLTPLLVAAACLLGANGVAVTMISVRAKTEGLSDAMVGLLGSFYFGGMILGVLLTPFLIARAGHIRVFSTLAAISAIAVLAISFTPAGWGWMLIRLVGGAAFCGTTMVLESWLNSIASNASRGRILSVYRIVDMTAVMGSQFLLPAFGPLGPDILIVLAILFCLALVPISLTSERNPQAPPARLIDPLMLWRVSPVALVTALTIGLTNGAFRMVGPIYVDEVGLGLETVAAFIAIWVFAGAVFQFPAGWLSDRFDRRVVLSVFTVGAGLSCLFISGSSGRFELFAGVFLFGGFALPLYSLCAAHANDHAEPGQFVDVVAGLTLAYGVGAMAGPFLASVVMAGYGASAFFVYTASLHLLLVVFILVRIFVREAVPADRRHRFVWLLRTSPMIFRLARNDRPEDERPPDK
ncbi:MFS transporter [Roseibium sediminicola]|uniref:MFS transporter n=1 Tax=Roseibium sediminicola TaxID=2933272 RepID=A0ABT0GUT6_9HYPH|nr:MFS transporter [Roseibium sp. CAU 1639]MCK7613191.1 MFS transporter [Roseibium sp. CAU 1639]